MSKQNISHIVIGVLLLWGVVAAYVVLDVCAHGPQVVRFNERCKRIVEDQNLLGQLPKAVATALGQPTSVFWYNKEGSFSLNYAPHPSFPFAVFQAHFKNGRLSSIELYDD